jgi:multidrug efflux system outer membrane protein
MRKPLLVTLLALLASGCMVGPDYVRPPVDTPTAWRLSEQDARDLANTVWWEQLGDPVLNDLVATALHENKDLMIAAARVDQFAGNYGIVRSGLFPQVGAGYEVRRQRDISAVVVGADGGETYNSYNAVLNASWEIDIWGRIRRQTEAARAQLLASEEGRRGVILSLVGSVAGAYINLRDLDRQLEIARVTAKSRGESYEIFKLRFEGGIISVLELSQNRSQYEEALATIPPLEKAIAQQENGLSVLLGRNPGPIPRGKDIDHLTLPAIPAGLPSDLLERRPDIRRTEQNLIAANALIGAARAAYFPTISLTGLFGYASTSLSISSTARARCGVTAYPSRCRSSPPAQLPVRCRSPKLRSSRRCLPTRRRSRRLSAKSTTRWSARTGRANNSRRSGARSRRCSSTQPPPACATTMATPATSKCSTPNAACSTSNCNTRRRSSGSSSR